MRISQAGLDWSKRQYIIISVAIGVALFVVVFLVGGGLIAAAGAGFALCRRLGSVPFAVSSTVLMFVGSSL